MFMEIVAYAVFPLVVVIGGIGVGLLIGRCT